MTTLTTINGGFSQQPKKPTTEIVIHRKYKLIEILGKGRFGTVYKGINNRSGEIVAIKFEPAPPVVQNVKSMDNHFYALKYETTILNYLYSKGCRKIPPIYWYGLHDKYTTLIMPFYGGGSLFQFIQTQHLNQNKPNTETSHLCTFEMRKGVNKIMTQMLCIIENIHSFGVIHRDIKPHNFMFYGSQPDKLNELDEYKLILIDFGMAGFSSYTNVIENETVNVSNIREHITGTPNYISYNIHNGKKPTEWDDLISIGYIYLYLLWGTLPWITETRKSSTIDPENYNPYTGSKYENTHICHPSNLRIMEIKKWNCTEKIILDYYENNENECSSIHKYLNYCYGKSEFCHRTNKMGDINYTGLIQLFRSPDGDGDGVPSGK